MPGPVLGIGSDPVAVGADEVARHDVAGATHVDPEALDDRAVARDEIPLARTGAADQVAGALDQNAAVVHRSQGRRALSVRADVVALHDVGTEPRDVQDAQVAADDHVAAGGVGASDDVAAAADLEAGPRGRGDHPRRVGSDEVSRDGVRGAIEGDTGLDPVAVDDEPADRVVVRERGDEAGEARRDVGAIDLDEKVGVVAAGEGVRRRARLRVAVDDDSGVVIQRGKVRRRPDRADPGARKVEVDRVGTGMDVGVGDCVAQRAGPRAARRATRTVQRIAGVVDHDGGGVQRSSAQRQRQGRPEQDRTHSPYDHSRPSSSVFAAAIIRGLSRSVRGSFRGAGTPRGSSGR